MKKLLLSLFVSLIGFICFGNCSYLITPSYTFTGTYSSDISNGSTITRFTFSFPIYQSVNFNTSDLGIYIDKFSVNGNDLSFSNSNGLYLYRLYPIVVNDLYFGGNFSYYQSAYFSSLSYYLSSNSNLKTYYNLIGLSFAIKNSSSSAYDCSTIPCEISAVIHFHLDNDYYVGGIYNPLTSTLNQCQSDLSQCQSSICISESTYNSCVSDLSNCNSLLSGYSNSLDICSSNYNNCSTSLNSCLQSNCPDSENPLDFNPTVYIYRNNSYFPITGSNNIYVNLPSYIGYNFDYSNQGYDLNIAVDISNDTGYINGIINEQSYIPTSEDLTNVFSNLGSFGGLLVVCLFVILVFYMFKKIFS